MAAAKGVPRLAVAPLGGSRYSVASETEPGKAYEVDLAAYSCSCRAGERGRMCKHVRAAQEFYNAQTEHKAKATEQMELGLDLPQPPVQGAAEKADRKPLKLGHAFDEVASALQKEIRNGDEEAAVYWGLILADASPHYAWKRVLITAAEDIGFAAPETVALVTGLAQAWAFCRQYSWYVSPHHLSMAVMALCRAAKSTEVEDLQSLTMELQKRGRKREVPEYALDGHTRAGKERGATDAEWYRNRHVVFGIPVNPYTVKLWDLESDWRPSLE